MCESITYYSAERVFVQTPSNLPMYASKDRSEGAVDTPQKTAVKVQWIRLKRPQ